MDSDLLAIVCGEDRSLRLGASTQEVDKEEVLALAIHDSMRDTMRDLLA